MCLYACCWYRGAVRPALGPHPPLYILTIKVRGAGLRTTSLQFFWTFPAKLGSGPK